MLITRDGITLIIDGDQGARLFKGDTPIALDEVNEMIINEYLEFREKIAQALGTHPDTSTDLMVSMIGDARGNHIGRNISIFRARKQLTQGELAAAAELTQGHVSQLENGKHIPNVATLMKIAKALDITIKDLDPRHS